MDQNEFLEFKNRQRAMWASFAPTATFTTPSAAHLVRFAGVQPGDTVLDAGCGTGVVAITAARAGAKVSALDLTPELLLHARANGALAGFDDLAWTEGDVENLPYPDASFDVVLSQFGHIFAPRPDVAIAEMRRVLKPRGRIAFASWPPEHFVGRLFALIGRHSPPPPPGVAPPVEWGAVSVVAERLAGQFASPFFERGTMTIPALSLAHFLAFMEQSVGPIQKVVERLANVPEALAQFRAEFRALTEPYYSENLIHQSYLLTRAQAA